MKITAILLNACCYCLCSDSFIHNSLLIKRIKFRRSNYVTLCEPLNNLEHSLQTLGVGVLKFPNVTVSEICFLVEYLSSSEISSPQTSYSHICSNLLQDSFKLNLDDRNKFLVSRGHVDKGTSNSKDVFLEVVDLAMDYEVVLNIFRRNIALRANRVLHPARNAQIFSQLINFMIMHDQWKSVRDIVSYVGLTPRNYCCEQPDGSIDIQLNSTVMFITRRMLELDLERMAWLREGREGAEPSTPKSRGESVQEWLYTQVHRSDLGFRTADMVLAVLRLSLRHALDILASPRNATIASGTCSIISQPSGPPPLIKVNLTVDSLIARAGIPLDELFLQRCSSLLRNDMALISRRLTPNCVIGAVQLEIVS